MRAFLFFLFYISTWLIAQIPSKVIYRFSDFSCFIVYRIAKYRRKVVRENLLNSFPEKSIEEIKKTEKKFYKHFCDLFYENIFLLHASRERALRRCRFNNLEYFEKLYAEGKSAILATGHYGNWELYALMGAKLKHIPLGVYKPLSNKRFERFINAARERFGGVPVSMKKTLKVFNQFIQEKKPVLLGLISDQTPAVGDIHYWTKFLNQDTPVFLGVEKISKRYNLPVIFCSMTKLKRGKYQVNFEVLSENPKDTKPYEITEMHVKALENLIRKQPEFWLWSHRRWKRKYLKTFNSEGE
jgi:KDO2-lipid IV(A) lauroyltransferase